MKRVAVVGGGITGVSTAKMLADDFDVSIFESKSEMGGLIRCDRVQGGLYHRVGGHVFNAKSEKVKDWLGDYVNYESDLIYQKRKARILYANELVGYPIENHLYQLPPKVAEKALGDILELDDSPDIRSFGAFLRSAFGETLYDIYFQPYNKKIWNTSLDEIPLDWLEGKLPMPGRDQIIQSNVFREDETEMVHATFFYPKEGGSQFWINRLGDGITTHCSSPVETMIVGEDGLRLNDKDWAFDKIVYTGDIRRFPLVMGEEDAALQSKLEECSQLRTRGVTNVLCECDQTDLSWLYIPEPKFLAHRIIYTGNFSPTNTQAADEGRSSCVVEFEYGTRKEEIRRQLDLLPGNLKFIEMNSEENAYIIQNNDTRLIIDQIKELLEGYGIYLAGRFAEWEYYNMDKCIERALSLSEQMKG